MLSGPPSFSVSSKVKILFPIEKVDLNIGTMPDYTEPSSRSQEECAGQPL